MGLREKTALTMGVALLALIAVLYLGSRRIIQDGFAHIEERDARKDVERVLLALAERRSTMELSVQDWSYWDDTYAFVQDRNEAFIRDNLTTRWLLEFAGCPVPAFACATIACAVVLYGVAFSLGPKPAGDGLAQDPSGGMAQAHDDHTLAPPPGVYLEASMADSSNPVFQTESSVLPVMRVNYVPPR